MIKSVVTFSFLIVWLSCSAQSKQIMVHDPVAIESNGTYYMYSTGTGIASWHSSDKVHWQFMAQVFNEIPAWSKELVPKFNENIWAPDISFHKGKYYLYYSISSFASNLSIIGVATNVTLNPQDENYSWEDHGPLVKSVPGRDNWNAIDPNLIFDEKGDPYLTYGSFWGGIKMVKLNPDLISIAEPQEWYTIASRERNLSLDDTDPGNAAIEAPFIVHKDDYYYLFVSFDLCCRGPRSTYNVRVGRSENIAGPYVDKENKLLTQGGGSLVIQGNDDYYGIGHNSVYEFDGSYIMYSHGYDIHDKGKPKLMVHSVQWDEIGWPLVTEMK